MHSHDEDTGIAEMELKAIERRMRVREAAHETALEDGAYIVVRLDGRSFGALSRALGLEKPFDRGVP